MAIGEVVGLLGSIASIVGLSKQLYDGAAKKFPGEAGQYLGLYMSVTELASAWKNVHHLYHANFKDFESLRRDLFNADGSVKRVDSIAPGMLRNKFRQLPSLSTSVRSFDADVKHELRHVIKNIDVSENGDHETKRISGMIDSRLVKSLEDIRYREKKFLNSHERVASYFLKISPLLRTAHWSQHQVEGIVGEFEGFFEDQQDCIMNADLILVESIFIFDSISPNLR